MRILMLLNEEFPPDIRVENEIRYLIEKGYQIHLVCYTKKNKPIIEEKGRLIIHRFPISKLLHKTNIGCLTFPFYFNFWRKNLRPLIQKFNFTSIHIHDLLLAQIGVELKEQIKVPLLIDLHENYPALLKDAKHTNTLLGKLFHSNKQWEQYEKTILKSADTIITVVEEMQNRIQKLGINREKIFVVSNVVNTDTFPLTDKKTEEKTIRLFYAGGITIHRGLQIVLKGLSLIKSENIEIIVAGDGSYLSSLKSQAKELGILNKIKFLGKIDQTKTYNYLQESDIALIPHLRSIQTDNSSPNKLYQYMYASKPMLASNCSSIERIINSEKIGIIYQHNDPNDFKNALIKLLNSDLKTLGTNGYKAAIKRYNWNKEKVKLLNSYKYLLKKAELNTSKII